jgi:hypothetical protein
MSGICWSKCHFLVVVCSVAESPGPALSAKTPTNKRCAKGVYVGITFARRIAEVRKREREASRSSFDIDDPAARE